MTASRIPAEEIARRFRAAVARIRAGEAPLAACRAEQLGQLFYSRLLSAEPALAAEMAQRARDRHDAARGEADRRYKAKQRTLRALHPPPRPLGTPRNVGGYIRPVASAEPPATWCTVCGAPRTRGERCCRRRSGWTALVFCALDGLLLATHPRCRATDALLGPEHAQQALAGRCCTDCVAWRSRPRGAVEVAG